MRGTVESITRSRVLERVFSARTFYVSWKCFTTSTDPLCNGMQELESHLVDFLPKPRKYYGTEWQASAFRAWQTIPQEVIMAFFSAFQRVFPIFPLVHLELARLAAGTTVDKLHVAIDDFRRF